MDIFWTTPAVTRVWGCLTHVRVGKSRDKYPDLGFYPFSENIRLCVG